MGRAIVRDPQVFLFDEPLSNLDAKLRVAMRAEIRELHQRLKATTIYVTHDQIEAMTMADNIVVMQDGIVEQVGTPLELFDRPRNVFVAAFIGSPSMNLLPVKVNGRGVVDNVGNHWAVPGVQGTSGQALTMGVRPEHLRLDAAGVEACVVVVESTGSETHLVVDAGGTKLTCVLRERVSVRPGDQGADIAVLTLPLAEETRGLMGASQFALMKPGAIFVNGSRGAIVQERALVETLDSGHLRAAGLDVFATEPLPMDSPLRTHAKVTPLPHIGSATHETRRAMAELATENLLRALAGQTPPSAFDLS